MYDLRGYKNIRFAFLCITRQTSNLENNFE